MGQRDIKYIQQPPQSTKIELYHISTSPTLHSLTDICDFLIEALKLRGKCRDRNLEHVDPIVSFTSPSS